MLEVCRTLLSEAKVSCDLGKLIVAAKAVGLADDQLAAVVHLTEKTLELPAPASGAEEETAGDEEEDEEDPELPPASKPRVRPPRKPVEQVRPQPRLFTREQIDQK